MRGKLITIEGTDASGKSTQLALLSDRLAREEIPFRKIAFPRYERESSALVRMYLGGEFGEDPDAVGAYTASSFFAVDRAASYLSEWGEYYENGGLVLLDRYTTSNAIYQGVKLADSERGAFYEWLFDYEYRLLRLPSPDLVFLLDMPPLLAEKLMRSRGNAEDIHERDKDYLIKCHDTAVSLAERFGWRRIDCSDGERIKEKTEIHDEIYNEVINLLAR